jgi:hypothetical protein
MSLDQSFDGTSPTPTSAAETPASQKKLWVAPVVEDLPRLADLTLVTGDAIPGGSSVF